MNSNTSNPDEAENSTGKSMKKNIPGLALLLLDLAVALVGFYIGTHVFWKDQNEESVIVAGAMSAAWATFSWAVFGVVPEFLRTLVFARPRGDDQFADCTFSPSLDMSR